MNRQSQDSTEINVEQPLKIQPEIPVKVEIPPPVVVLPDCEKVLSVLSAIKFDKKTPDFLQIELNSQTKFTEESLALWAFETVQKAFASGVCAYQKIGFIGSGADDVLYVGLLSKPDYELYLQQKISQAEITRRFDIKKLTTLVSIQKNLKTARETKSLDKAEPLVNEWLEKDPQNIIAKTIKANICLEKKSYFDAITLYEEVLKTKVDDLYSLFNLAYAKKQIGSFGEAIAIYQKLKTMDLAGFSVGKEDLLMNLADVYLSNHQLKEVEETLTEVANKDSLDFLILQSNLLRAKKQFEESKTVLTNALLQKKSDIVLYNFVLLNLDLKDVVAAKESLAELKISNPKLAAELAFLEPFQERKEISEVKVEDKPADPVVTPSAQSELKPQNQEEEKSDEDKDLNPLF